MPVRVKVRLKPEGKEVELTFDSEPTVAELLRRLNLSAEAAVAVIGGRVVPEWERVRDGEEVTVIRAVSGG